MGAAKDASWIETMTHPHIRFLAGGRSDAERQSIPGALDSVRRHKYHGAGAGDFPISVTITGDVAVAHYRYRTAFKVAEEEREMVTGRYTDVFIKEGNRWLFITWTRGATTHETDPAWRARSGLALEFRALHATAVRAGVGSSHRRTGHKRAASWLQSWQKNSRGDHGMHRFPDLHVVDCYGRARVGLLGIPLADGWDTGLCRDKSE